MGEFNGLINESNDLVALFREADLLIDYHNNATTLIESVVLFLGVKLLIDYQNKPKLVNLLIVLFLEVDLLFDFQNNLEIPVG